MTESKGAGIHGTSLLLGAVLGTGLGSVLGWLLSRRSMEKEIAREVAGVRKYYADKASAEAAAGEDGDSGERPEATVADHGRILASGRVITKIENPRVTIVLDPDNPALEGFERVGSGDDEEEDDDDDDSPPESVSRDTTKPYAITGEEFLTEFEDFNKISLTFYMGDGTLCDERDAPIRDTSIVGKGFADFFGQDPADPDIIHVRNEKLTVDFEIARRHGTYTEEVLGYGKPQ